MADNPGLLILQNEIEKAREKLRDVNENLKKLTGRESVGFRPFSGRRQDFRGRGRFFGNSSRDAVTTDGFGGPAFGSPAFGGPVFGGPAFGGPAFGVPTWQQYGRGGFSRMGPMLRNVQRRDSADDDDDDDELSTKAVQSSIVATTRQVYNRPGTLVQRGMDNEGMQRNRRMFGVLMGTLQKFKSEAKVRDKKAKKRDAIEKKLEENAEREKLFFHLDTQELIKVSHMEQTKIARLQQKMEFANEHGAHTNEMKKLHNFICTKSRPRIFWKPKVMTLSTEGILKESKKTVDKMIRHKGHVLEREVKKIMELEQQREERILSRLRQDKENASQHHLMSSSTEGSVRSSISIMHDIKEPEKSHGHRKVSGRHHKEVKKRPREVKRDVDDAIVDVSKVGVEKVEEHDQESDGEQVIADMDAQHQSCSLDDGNNTDIDYEDEISLEEDVGAIDDGVSNSQNIVDDDGDDVNGKMHDNGGKQTVNLHNKMESAEEGEIVDERHMEIGSVYDVVQDGDKNGGVELPEDNCGMEVVDDSVDGKSELESLPVI